MRLYFISSALLALSLAFSPSLLAMGESDAQYLAAPSDAMIFTVESNTELIGLSPATLLEDSLKLNVTETSPGLRCAPTGGVSLLASGKPGAVTKTGIILVSACKPLLPT